jgi:hypothetical protein
MIYWGTADSYLVALDARTGKPVWEVQTGDYTTGEGHAHPPIIAEGKVFIGNAGGDFGARGKVQAFDAEPGGTSGRFTRRAAAGRARLDTWGQCGRRSAAAPWNTISYDPDLRLVYASTGQPTPWTAASADRATRSTRTPCWRSRPRRAAPLALPARAGRQLGPRGVREHAGRSRDRRRHAQGADHDRQDRLGRRARSRHRRVPPRLPDGVRQRDDRLDARGGGRSTPATRSRAPSTSTPARCSRSARTCMARGTCRRRATVRSPAVLPRREQLVHDRARHAERLPARARLQRRSPSRPAGAGLRLRRRVRRVRSGDRDARLGLYARRAAHR